MIASNHVATLCLFIVMTIRPFLQESHNTVLTTGQAAVGMTIFCGFALELGASINEPVMGWLLILMNVYVVIVSLAQQLTEKLRTLPWWCNFACGANYPHQALKGGCFVFVWRVGT